MFESKTKLSKLVAKMVNANGGQEMAKPAIRDGQGDKNNSVMFWYRKNSPDMTVTSEK